MVCLGWLIHGRRLQGSRRLGVVPARGSIPRTATRHRPLVHTVDVSMEILNGRTLQFNQASSKLAYGPQDVYSE